MRFNFEATMPVALDFGPEDVAPLNQTIKILDYYVGNNDFDGESADKVTAVRKWVLEIFNFFFHELKEYNFATEKIHTLIEVEFDILLPTGMQREQKYI